MNTGAGFAFWSYRRPVGHSKSRAVRAGDAPMVTEWAYAPIRNGVIIKSAAVSGFVDRAAAERHAIANPSA